MAPRVVRGLVALVTVIAATSAPLPAVAADTQTQACPQLLGATAAPGQPGEMDYTGQSDLGGGAYLLGYQWGPSGAGQRGPGATGQRQAQVLTCGWIDANSDGRYQPGEALFGRVGPDDGSATRPAVLSLTVQTNLGSSVCTRAGFINPNGTLAGNDGPVDCENLIAAPSRGGPAGATADQATGGCASVIGATANAAILATYLTQRNNANGTHTLTFRHYSLQGAGGNVSSLDYQSCLWLDDDQDGVRQGDEELFGRLETRRNTDSDFFSPVLSATVRGAPGDTVCVQVGGAVAGSGRFNGVNPPACIVLQGAFARHISRSSGGGVAIPPPGRVAGVHSAPSITEVLRSPAEISLKPADLARSALLAAALLVLVGFPGQLFNSTLQSHYDEVVGWFGFLRRRKPKPDPAAAPLIADALPWWTVPAVFVAVATLSGFVDPKFGFDLASLELVIGILGAMVVTTVIYTGTSALLLRGLYHRWGRFRLFPGGIVIALACIVLSRVTAAQPGYVYGVMMGYTIGAVSMPKQHQGRLAAVGYLVMLAASLLAWAAWSPVKAAAVSGGIPLQVLSSILASIFLGGMCSMMFGLMPLRFLDGEKLLAWRRVLWVVLFGVGLFLFVHVVLNNAAGSPTHGHSYSVAIAMFAGFGAVSTAFWAYFRFRPEPLPANN